MNMSDDLELTELADRLPWHKPAVQRLVIAADTHAFGSSTEDFDGFGFSPVDLFQ